MYNLQKWDYTEAPVSSVILKYYCEELPTSQVETRIGQDSLILFITFNKNYDITVPCIVYNDPITFILCKVCKYCTQLVTVIYTMM